MKQSRRMNLPAKRGGDLNEQFSRDLGWLLNCPSLLDSELVFDTTNLQCGEGGTDFSPVLKFLNSPASYRVGYYVESLVEIWLRRQGGFGGLKHAVQINDQERTLGELDFIYRLDGVLNHLEIALKFYLYDPNENGSGSHFAGPNAKDTFEKKCDKLLNFQIAVGRRHFPEIKVSQVMMKGMIFYPPSVARPENLPKGLNPAHRSGVWIRESEGHWLSSSSGFASGRVMEKPYWLSGLAPESELPVQTIDELRETVKNHFQCRRHPLLLSVGDTDGRETERVFVVHQEWPNQASPMEQY